MVRVIEPPSLRKYLEDRFSAKSIDADDAAAYLDAEISEVLGEDFAEISRQNRSVLDTMNQALNEAIGARDVEDFELYVPDHITNEQFIGAVLDFYKSQGMEPFGRVGNGYMFSREDRQVRVYCTSSGEDEGKTNFFVTVTER